MIKLLLVVITFGINSLALADCGGPAGGMQSKEEVFTVEHCRIVDPSKEKRIVKFNKDYAQSMGNAEDIRRHDQKVLNAYRGVVIEAKDSSGVSKSYFLGDTSKSLYEFCGHLKKKQEIKGIVGQACCDGDSNPPCFLGIKDFFYSGSLKKKVEAPVLSGRVFVKKNNIFYVNLGKTIQLTHKGKNRTPTLSPDGKKVYYLAMRNGSTPSQVRVVNIDRTDEHTVTAGESFCVIPHGGLAGYLIVEKHKYFLTGGSYDFVWLVTPEGMEQEPVASDMKSIYWDVIDPVQWEFVGERM